jgi:hypothetical protein
MSAEKDREIERWKTEVARLNARLNSLVVEGYSRRIDAAAGYHAEIKARMKLGARHDIARMLAEKLLELGCIQFTEKEMPSERYPPDKDLVIEGLLAVIHPRNASEHGLMLGWSGDEPPPDAEDSHIEEYALRLAKREPRLIEHGSTRFALRDRRPLVQEYAPGGLECMTAPVATVVFKRDERGRVFARVVSR